MLLGAGEGGGGREACVGVGGDGLGDVVAPGEAAVVEELAEEDDVCDDVVECQDDHGG